MWQANEADLTGPWPDEGKGKPPREVLQKWEEAKQKLVFKVGHRVVGKVADAVGDLPDMALIVSWLLCTSRSRWSGWKRPSTSCSLTFPPCRYDRLSGPRRST